MDVFACQVKGNRALEEGDVVMFGHPCGKDIKPGQPATYVADSEFEFLVRTFIQYPPMCRLLILPAANYTHLQSGCS